MSIVKSITFSLPMPPGINNQYVTLKNGRRALSAKSKKWKRTATQQLQGLRDRGLISEEFLRTATKGYLCLFVDFYFKTPLRRDLDGGLKILQDTICEALGTNDNRVVDIHLVKRIDPLNPRVDVHVDALSEWQFDHEYQYTASPQA